MVTLHRTHTVVDEGVVPAPPGTADETPRERHRPPPAPAGAPTTRRRRPPRLVEVLWADRRLAVLVAALVPVLLGLGLARWTPRGPLTPAQGLATMGLTLLAGGVAGLVLRSRWAALVAPVAFAAAFELARIGTDGPTVDGIVPWTEYGVYAFVVGRGVNGVLALVPIVFGALLGAGGARWLADGRAHHGWSRVGVVARRTVAVVTAVALVLVAVAVARPGRTAPIVDAAGRPVEGSVAELTHVDVDGHSLGLMIRGWDTTDPVLLFLPGGPGGSELGAMRNHLSALEEHFVVATLDQRGTGRAYGELDPTSTMTPEGAVADVIAVTEQLQDRFGPEPVYLVGNSWGTIVGVWAVQQRPDLYAAFVGAGQMVDPAETDRIFYDDTVAWARDTGQSGLVSDLAAIGPPPYEDILDYETALSHEHEVYAYDHSANSEGEDGFTENLGVEEYTQLEQLHALAGFFDTFSTLYPQVQDVDLRVSATELAVPVYLAQGAHEAAGRAEPAGEWFDLLVAPHKEVVVFDTSGHRPLFEQPDEFVSMMVDTVLAQTS